MKILLILPSARTDEGTLSDFTYMLKLLTPDTKAGGKNIMAFMPLALPTLAAMVPPDADVRIVDENVEPIPFDEKVDLVGISFVSFMAPRAYQIADAFRARGVHVVLGGGHVTLLYQEAMAHADTVVLGEAEEVWPQFLEDFANKKPKGLYRAERKPDLQRLVIPRWDLVHNRHYLTQLVQTTRGCNQDCDFCTIRAIFGPPRVKPVENVLAEIEATKRLKRFPGKYKIMFADDNIIGNAGYAKNLFKAMIPLDIRWSSQLSIHLAQDDELLELAKQSGCDTVLIGFESISQKNLDSVNKGRINRTDSFRKAIEKIQSRGINIYGYFIFGLDDDDPSVFEATVRFVQHAGIEYPLFNILSPFPGTRLYDRMMEEGRLGDYDFAKLNGYSVCFKPKNMTPEELEQGFRWAIAETYSHENILGRIHTGYGRGSLRGESPDTLARVAVTGLLLRELPRCDAAQRLFLGEMIKTLWTLRDIKINALLMFLDRFEFGQRLRRGMGPCDAPSSSPSST